MIFLFISQLTLADSFCSSLTTKQKHTLETLSIYFATENCEETLKKLKKASSVSIVGKEIEDISVFSSAQKLEYLNLSRNNIQDTSALTSLEQIKWLDLSGNPIGTMTNLPTGALESFWCVDCQIMNWETNGKMNKLRYLSLRSNELNEIDVKSFPKLNSLLVSENNIVDPSILSANKNIKVVELYGNPIDMEKCPQDKKIARGLRRACFSLKDRGN